MGRRPRCQCFPGEKSRRRSVTDRKLLFALPDVLSATRVRAAPRVKPIQREPIYGLTPFLAELTSGNLLRVTPSFQFRVVTADPDDNIFTDGAITAGADYLLTEDSHFAPLADAGYKPRPLSPQQFVAQFVASAR